MAIAKKAAQEDLFVDREVIRHYLQNRDDADESSETPLLTAKEVRQLMLQAGIRPEDNEFSRGIIAMREE